MGETNQSSLPKMNHSVALRESHTWVYETDEFHGICEIAHDDMVVKCVFKTVDKKFYDVLLIDGVIKNRLLKPVSVERLCQQLSDDFQDLEVTVMGRAKTHGWITSTCNRSWG